MSNIGDVTYRKASTRTVTTTLGLAALALLPLGACSQDEPTKAETEVAAPATPPYWVLACVANELEPTTPGTVANLRPSPITPADLDLTARAEIENPATAGDWIASKCTDLYHRRGSVQPGFADDYDPYGATVDPNVPNMVRDALKDAAEHLSGQPWRWNFPAWCSEGVQRYRSLFVKEEQAALPPTREGIGGRTPGSSTEAGGQSTSTAGSWVRGTKASPLSDRELQTYDVAVGRCLDNEGIDPFFPADEPHHNPPAGPGLTPTEGPTR
jgi:hypothetical protein